MAIQFNVDQALERIGALVTQHGPEAVKAAESVVQINAINTLSGFPGYAVLAAMTVWAARFCLNRLKACGGGYDDELPRIAWGLSFAATALAAFGLAWASIAALLDVWAWVAIFNPRLALAHEIFAKLVGG